MEDIFDKIEREFKYNNHLDEMVEALKENHWKENVILRSARKQQVLHEFLVSQKTHSDIAAELGITTTHVREIKDEAMIEMQHYLNRMKFTPDEKTDAEKFSHYDVRNIMLRPDEDDINEIKWLLLLPVEDLELSVRAFNCLKGNRIDNLNDLLGRCLANDLLLFRNCGKKTFEEIEGLMARKGLKWQNAPAEGAHGFNYYTYLQNLKHIVIPPSYELANFTWSNEILGAFGELKLVTVKDLLVAYQPIKRKLKADDFGFIKDRMNVWGLHWK